MATKQGGGGGGRGSALSLSLCLSADSSLSCLAEQRDNIGYRYISEVAHTYACTHMHTHTHTHTRAHACTHAKYMHYWRWVGRVRRKKMTEECAEEKKTAFSLTTR